MARRGRIAPSELSLGYEDQAGAEQASAKEE